MEKGICPNCGDCIKDYVWNEEDECYESYECETCGSWS